VPHPLEQGLEREHAELAALIELLEREQHELCAPAPDGLDALQERMRQHLMTLSELHEANQRLGREPAPAICAQWQSKIRLATEKARRLNTSNARLLLVPLQATSGRLEALRSDAGLTATYTQDGLLRTHR
jgi:flagellar biosynthesis/type III secretory pathway chaperone